MLHWYLTKYVLRRSHKVALVGGAKAPKFSSTYDFLVVKLKAVFRKIFFRVYIFKRNCFGE